MSRLAINLCFRPIFPCHHHDLDLGAEHESGDHENSGICYLTNSHTPNTASSQLITTKIVTEYYLPDPVPIYITTTTYLPVEPLSHLLPGSSGDLLRPPRV